MADKSYYQSEFTGEQIDAAIGIIISGNVDQAAQIATEQANRATEEADRAEFAADRAEQMGGKTSYIGDNGNWFEWDYATGNFVDSGTPARGEKGDTGAAGVVDYSTVNQIIEASYPLPIGKGGTGATTPAAALAALGAVKIASGSYAGTGDTTKTVAIGFKPLFFITQTDTTASAQYGIYSGQPGKVGSSASNRAYTVTDTDITITSQSGASILNSFNATGNTYHWVAIG